MNQIESDDLEKLFQAKKARGWEVHPIGKNCGWVGKEGKAPLLYAIVDGHVRTISIKSPKADEIIPREKFPVLWEVMDRAKGIKDNNELIPARLWDKD